MRLSRFLLPLAGLLLAFSLSGCGSLNLWGQNGSAGGAAGGASLRVPLGSGGDGGPGHS